MKKSLLILFALLHTLVTKAQLNGTYTIGGTTPDYNTFNDAVNALVSSGVSAAVTFNIRDGVYAEKLSIPAITGASAVNTITFQSQSGDSTLVVLTDSATASSTNNFTLQINGGDYITFRKMTISRTGAGTYSTVVTITNTSTGIRFLNNHILGTNSATTLTTNSVLVYSSASNDSANVFSNCLLENGSYGLYLLGVSSTTLESGTIISDNIFLNNFGRPLHLGNQNAPTINGNEISTNSTLAAFYGMYFSACKNNMVVDGNKVSAPAGGYGMYFTAVNGTGPLPARVSNNFIHVGGTGTAYGTYYTGSSFINFWNNSVHVTAPGATSNCFFSTGSTNKLIVQNNVLVNSGGGYTYNIQSSALNTLSLSNFNDLYSTGTNLCYFNAGALTDLNAWRLATGLDANSVSIDPIFASASDLHAFGGGINNVGTPLAAITFDIDGEVRDSVNPDMGADEFAPLADNIAVTALVSPASGSACGDSAVAVEVTVINIGSNAQSGIPVQVEVTGPVTVTLYDTIAGPVLPNTGAQLLFSQTINTTGGGQYNFKTFTSLANDQYRNNDTLLTERNFYALPNSPLAQSPQQICDNNTTITASADSGYTLFWYDQPTGGNLIFTGEPFTPALNSDTTFYVEAREGSGSSGCLRITECEIGGASDFVEVQNLSGAGFDATGWIVAVSDNYTTINTVNAITWPLGFFNAGEIQYRTDVTTTQYWGSNILWNPGNNGWAILIDPLGVVKDFVAWGWADTDIQNMNTIIGGFNITIGQEWTGAGFTSCATGSISRNGSSDSNDSTDFVCETSSMGTQNINLAPMFANCGLGLCSSLRVQVDITLVPGVAVNLGNDTMLSTPFSYLLDAGAGFTFYFWSDNSTGQTLTVTQPGIYWVTVAGSNGCYFTDTIAINMGVGITSTGMQDVVHVYPNPANENLHIELTSSAHVEGISLMDINGRIIYEQMALEEGKSNSIVVDTRKFASGIYYLRFLGEVNIKAVKVIIE